MRKKLLAVFSALLLVCSLGAVGMSVSAEQNTEKQAIEPVTTIYYGTQIGESGFPGIVVNMGEVDSVETYWAPVTTDKVAYRDKDGNNKLTTVETCGTGFAIRGVTPELDDVLTVYAGFTWNGKEVKYDTVFHYDGNPDVPWYIERASTYVHKADIDSTKTDLSGMVVEHSTAWGATVINFTTNHPGLSGYMNLIKGGLKKEDLEIDKSLISYTDKNGNDKLFSLRLYDNIILVDAATSLGGYQVGDILTIKAGFVWGNFQAKKDLVYTCQGEGKVFATSLDNYTNKFNLTVNSLQLYYQWATGDSSGVQLWLQDVGNAFVVPNDYLSTMNIVYTTVNGERKEISDFTALTPNDSFLFRFVDKSYRLQAGDIFVIKANSFVPNGTNAYVFASDVAFRITDPNNQYGYETYVLAPCTVTFDPNGGTFTGSTSVTVSEGSIINEPADPEKPATAQYTFAFEGWFLNGVEYDFSKPVTGNITLVAKWSETLRSYTATFNSNGGTAVSSQTKKYGEFFTEPTAPTKASTTTSNFEFAGWTLYGEPYDFDTTEVTGDILLVASWNEVPKTFTVTYNSNGGTAVDSETVAYGTCFTKPADPTKAADANYTYTFDCWTLGGQPYDFTLTATRNITLTAKWTATPIGGGDPVDPPVTKTYTVTFNSNGGTTVASQTINENATATRPADPTRAADANYTYTFAGWQLNGVDYNFSTPVTGNITLVAKWTATPIVVNYTVTFNTVGGTAVDSQTVEEGAKATMPTAPTKAEDDVYTYTFGGWLLNGVEYNFSTPVTSNIELVANWIATKKTFNVTFDANGGVLNGAEVVAVVKGEKVSEPTAPIKHESLGWTFEFAGWTLNGEDFDFETAITGDITLVAKWTAISPEVPDLGDGFPENPEDGEFEDEMNKGVGCGSIVGSTLIPSMVALLGAGIVVARKKKQK